MCDTFVAVDIFLKEAIHESSVSSVQNSSKREEPAFHDNQAEESDRQAEFVGLLGLHYREMYSCAISLGVDIHETDDILQDVSIFLWKNFDQYEAGTSFSKWGKAVVRNTVRNHLRSQWRKRYLFNPLLVDKIFEMQRAAEELFDLRLVALNQCLKKLPTTERKLIRIYYQQGLAPTEKTRETGKTPTALRKAVSRIRLRLAQCVDKKLGVDNE